MSPRTRRPTGPGLDDELAAARDEQIAREEISRYYADKLAAAEKALAAAKADHAAVELARSTWEQSGQITTTYPGPVQPDVHDAHLCMQVMAILGDSQGRYIAVARQFLEPALKAPAATAQIELDRLHRRPEAPALKAAADAARERYEALGRWLSTQGYDTGPGQDVSTGRRRRGGAR